MNKKASYDTSTPIEGKDASSGPLLKPGAREPVSHQSGNNTQERQVKKMPAPGKLGARHFA